MSDRNPSKRESFEGATLCLDNARRLLNASTMIAQDSYGPATSLAILSGEEAVKGTTYLLKWIGFEKHDRKVFHKLLSSSHQLRHETSLAVDGVVDLVSGNLSDLVENTEAWQNAEDIKQAGFYVDFGDDGWETPRNVTKTEYKTYRKGAEKRIERLSRAISSLRDMNDREIDLVNDLGDEIAKQMREWQNEYDEEEIDNPSVALFELAQRILPLLPEWASQMKQASD